MRAYVNVCVCMYVDIRWAVGRLRLNSLQLNELFILYIYGVQRSTLWKCDHYPIESTHFIKLCSLKL